MHALFFATHQMDAVDVRLLRHYVDDLKALPEAALFLLLFRAVATPPLSQGELEAWRDHEKKSGAPGFLWNEDGLRHLYPRLKTALSRKTNLEFRHTPRHVAKYFFFHASLMLWKQTFGHVYPSIDFWWRIEPDALFAGPLSDMVRLSLPVRVDLMLPNIQSKPQYPSWPHWQRNAEEFEGVADEMMKHSLVSFGRYSNRLLAVMARRWEAGRLGYEEISIATACANSGSDLPCTMGSFARARIFAAKRCVYRPVWNCSAFLKARIAESHELWHPVKERQCLVEWFDQRTPEQNTQ